MLSEKPICPILSHANRLQGEECLDQECLESKCAFWHEKAKACCLVVLAGSLWMAADSIRYIKTWGIDINVKPQKKP